MLSDDVSHQPEAGNKWISTLTASTSEYCNLQSTKWTHYVNKQIQGICKQKGYSWDYISAIKDISAFWKMIWQLMRTLASWMRKQSTDEPFTFQEAITRTVCLPKSACYYTLQPFLSRRIQPSISVTQNTNQRYLNQHDKEFSETFLKVITMWHSKA